MIVQSLVKYYDILARDKSVNISKPGFSPANVSFALVISPDGNLTNIIDIRTDAKKKVPRVMDVPLQKSRAGISPQPYFLCDKGEYIFGFENVKRKEFEKKNEKSSQEMHVLSRNDKFVTIISPRSRECSLQFKSFHHSLLDGHPNSEVQAFLKFLDEWKMESSLEHPKIAEYLDEIAAGGFFVFDIGGEYLHENPVIREVWESYYSSIVQSNSDSNCSQCLVSGKCEPIAVTHQKIKGVYGAQSAGASLVSFNDDSFYSYGKEQSYNAPISESAMFKYTTALNYLLHRGSRNRVQIGDTSTVFWADTNNQSCIDLAHFIIDPTDAEGTDAKEPESTQRQQDLRTRQLVSDILQKVKNGRYLEEKDLGVSPEKTKFYILGLAPNNARIAVRFWHEDSFGNFITRVARHHLDLEIEHDDCWPNYISIYRLLRETVPRESTDKAASPLLGGLLMRSILENTPYPVPMYAAILSRVKVERSINYVRAGFIKACLIRLARAKANHEEEMITVSLNEENPNVSYRLGRLFAILESAQKVANPNVKRTIRDSYFASASSTPGVVFPILLKLSQHHLSKINSEKPGLGVNISKSMDDVISSIDRFPVNLTLEEQGMFMLGYYHQHESFFRKVSEPAAIEGE